MRFLAKIFFVVFFLYAVFLLGVPSSNHYFSDTDYPEGRVLGVDEEEDDFEPVDFLNNFPENDIKSLPPIKKDEDNEFYLDNEIGAVLDCESGEVIYSKSADKQVPVASITKLATALVFLENNPGLQTLYKVRSGDRVEGGQIYLYGGEEVHLETLLRLSLIASANTATMALVHSTGMTEAEFVGEMNNLAKELGLEKTSFEDPVGLGADNLSTAEEVARLINVALEREEIENVLSMSEYIFTTNGGRIGKAYNTNKILGKSSDRFTNIAGKTGFTNLAGYCFAGKFELDDEKSIISVILGSDNKGARFSKAENMAEWIFKSYIW